MQIYFNGQFMADNEAQVSINDRSYRFGDGVFETALIYNGKIWDWPRHAARLQKGLEFFKLDIDIKNIPQIAAALIEENNIGQGYVRVVISRGETEGVGYKVTPTKPVMLVQVTAKPLPEFQTIKLFVSSTRAFYHYPCKTNNALHYTMALMEAESEGCENAVMLSPDDIICETATGNLFWIKDNMLYTPSTDLPFVLGTVRAAVLELWPGEAQEGKFTLDDLRNADEIFMTNVGGIVTAVSEVAPLGIRGNSQNQTMQIRKNLLAKIYEI